MRTHIVHDRNETTRRTIGYRVTQNGTNLDVVAAEARCHPNDNFNRSIARSIVESRLNNYADTTQRERVKNRVFEASLANTKMPSNMREWREVEQTLLLLSEYRLPSPAALR